MSPVGQALLHTRLGTTLGRCQLSSSGQINSTRFKRLLGYSLPEAISVPRAYVRQYPAPTLTQKPLRGGTLHAVPYSTWPHTSSQGRDCPPGCPELHPAALHGPQPAPRSGLTGECPEVAPRVGPDAATWTGSDSHQPTSHKPTRPCSRPRATAVGYLPVLRRQRLGSNSPMGTERTRDP